VRGRERFDECRASRQAGTGGQITASDHQVVIRLGAQDLGTDRTHSFSSLTDVAVCRGG
jgi:hypothetical protein